MRDFVRKLITELRLLDIGGSGPIVIGLSGGADSAALACGLSELRSSGKLNNRLFAAHFDHRLRGVESAEDELFVRNLASAFELEYCPGHAGDDEIQGNTEQSARRARYGFLLRTAASKGSGLVVTGHTINDQAETFLLNLLRGSGPDGLAAMPVKREMNGSNRVSLVRPLLRWATREMTVQYCRDIGVDYRNDSMNDDSDYNRVRVRKEVIPMLRQFNPQIIESLAKTAGYMRDAKSAFEHLFADNEEINELVNSRLLAVGKLKAMPPELMQLTIRAWVANQIGNLKGISSAHLIGIADLVRSEKSGKTVELPGGMSVVKGLGKLELKGGSVD